MIQPKEYIKRMENTKNKYDFLESIQGDQTLELCRMFLLGLREKIKNIENKKEIIELLAQSLKKDRTKSQILGFTKLNLLEMTRKKL